MQFRNGVFIITEEVNCPLYHLHEELKINEGILSLPAGKPTCLTLTKELIAISTSDTSYENYSQGSTKKRKFECGGCKGLISFEYQKDKAFVTLQMNLLVATERREQLKDIFKFADLLNSIEIFSTLSKDELLDLTALLELNEYPWQFPITEQGDPGNRLFILLDGKAEVIDGQGTAQAELGKGEVFGEMSLLSGDRVSMTVMAAEPCQVAVMSQKNFHHIINRFPVLQVYFYKLLVSRITTMNAQRAQELSSGMVGQLSDISPVELCQMINATQKTGRLDIEVDELHAKILFHDGELIKAEIADLKDKEAFYEILTFEEGRFKFSQGLTLKEKKLGVLGGFMGMLMEGIQRIDDMQN